MSKNMFNVMFSRLFNSGNFNFSNLGMVHRLNGRPFKYLGKNRNYKSLLLNLKKYKQIFTNSNQFYLSNKILYYSIKYIIYY